MYLILTNFPSSLIFLVVCSDKGSCSQGWPWTGDPSALTSQYWDNRCASLWLVFFGTKDWTQGFMPVRQALCPFSHPSARTISYTNIPVNKTLEKKQTLLLYFLACWCPGMHLCLHMFMSDWQQVPFPPEQSHQPCRLINGDSWGCVALFFWYDFFFFLFFEGVCIHTCSVFDHIHFSLLRPPDTSFPASYLPS